VPEDQSKISYDLDWMLQSEKVSDADLARALTRTYYLEIYYLSTYFIKDIEKAEKAAKDAIAEAVRHRSEFWGTNGLRVWIFQRAVRICRKSNGVLRRKTGQGGKEIRLPASLNSPEKYLLLLRYGIGLGADEIAHLTNQPEEKVRSRLKYLRSKTGMRQEAVEIPAQEKHETVVGLEKKADGIEIVGSFTGYEEHLRNCSICRAAVEYLKDADEFLKNAAAEAYPKPNLSEGQILAAARDIVNSAAVFGEKKLLSMRLKEIGFVLGAIALVGIVVFSTNLLAPNEPLEPEIVYIPVTATPPANNLQTFHGKGEADKIGDLPKSIEPLKMTSTVDEIIKRMKISSSLWDRLWVEGVIFDYGPLGYIGPPQVYYNRVWIEQPNSILVLGGQQELPDYFLMYSGFNFYERVMGSTIHLSMSGSDISSLHLRTPFSLVNNQSSSGTLFGYQLHDLLYPAFSDLLNNIDWEISKERIEEGGEGSEQTELNVIVLGIDDINGREAIRLRVDSSDGRTIQLSVDTKTGMILRQREFSGTIPSEIIREIVITSIRYTAEFPSSLMNPQMINQDIDWEDIWIPEDEGRRKPVGLLQSEHRYRMSGYRGTTPPEGFDPAESSLSFEYSVLPQPEKPDTWEAVIFADVYPVLSFPVGDPWNLTCMRSPDGSWITMAQNPNFDASDTENVYWINLLNPQITVKPAGSRFGLGTAFSPDSKYLVYSQTGSDGSPQGLFLYDLESYQVRRLMEVPFSAYFTWKPDSKQIAFFGGQRTTDLIEYVVDVELGEIVYQAEASIQNRTLNPESPAADWGVQFPPEYGGLERCVER